MALRDFVQGDESIKEIAARLDLLDQRARIAEMYALPGRDQARLYEKAGDAEPLGFEHFVPGDLAALTPVVHHGKNSQPAFKYFQKRWCRPRDRSDQLWGYNETIVRPLIGPGYFVAHETEDGGADPRGAIVVDYFMVPDDAVVDGWPAVKPNSSGLQKFVYHKTRDYMRKVSEHVSIGMAVRMESRVMGYFVLCRDDGTGQLPA